MKLLKLQKRFRTSKKRSGLSKQAMSNLRHDWLYTRSHPRSVNANKILAQYTATSFMHHVANPFKKKTVELETEFLKQKKRLLLQYFLLTIVLFIPYICYCLIITHDIIRNATLYIFVDIYEIDSIIPMVEDCINAIFFCI